MQYFSFPHNIFRGNEILNTIFLLVPLGALYYFFLSRSHEINIAWERNNIFFIILWGLCNIILFPCNIFRSHVIYLVPVQYYSIAMQYILFPCNIFRGNDILHLELNTIFLLAVWGHYSTFFIVYLFLFSSPQKKYCMGANHISWERKKRWFIPEPTYLGLTERWWLLYCFKCKSFSRNVAMNQYQYMDASVRNY